MGELLKTDDIVPDQIICSTARRARHTAQLVAEAALFDGKPQYDPDLYSADAENYLNVIREKAGDADTIMVVGHNPSVSDLVDLLTDMTEELPTAALARIELPIQDWSELDGDVEGKLLVVWRPRELADRRL
jgi:phosphohistidine phosphatase